MISPSLTSKPVATVSPGLASKSVATVFPDLASKLVAWVSRFGPQNRLLWFGNLSIKIITTVSWYEP
jgi:hypothetical protein